MAPAMRGDRTCRRFTESFRPMRDRLRNRARGWPALALAAAAAVALGACGSSNSSTRSRSATPAATTTPRKVTASLPKPLLAGCLPSKPAVARFNQAVGKDQVLEGWKVIYRLKPTVTSVDETALVVLLENPPVLPAGFVKGGRFISVAGRRVSLLARPAPTYGFVARWKTSSAVYIAQANGRQAPALEHVIGCMP